MNRLQLHIAEPCHADWAAMDGDARKRFCGQCDTHVHDLSAMTQRQATALLAREDAPCVRYTCTPDGGIRFRPERKVSLLQVGLLAGGLLIAGVPAEASTTPDMTPPAEEWSLVDWLSDVIWPQDTDTPALNDDDTKTGPEATPPPKPEETVIEAPPEHAPILMGRISVPEPPPVPLPSE